MQRVPSQLRRGVRRAVEDTTGGRLAYKAYLLAAQYPGSALRRPLALDASKTTVSALVEAGVMPRIWL